jgi:hypothetical protein
VIHDHFITEALPQQVYRPLINLNADQGNRKINKMFCQRTLSRTDFNDDVTIVEIEAFHNLTKDILIP